MHKNDWLLLTLVQVKDASFTYTKLVVNAVDSASASVPIVCQESAAQTNVK